MKTIACLVLAAAATGAGATTLYDNGPFNGSNGYSGTNNNDFYLNQNSTVTHATMQILANPGDQNTPSGNINWAIYADGGGFPGGSEGSGSSSITNATYLGQAFGSYNIWDIELSNFGNIPLNSGYHFFEMTTNNGADVAYWCTANGGGYNNSVEFSFTIQGNVPAPASASVLGLVGLAASRRRRS